ncbi:MAG: hypothetical protein J5922_00870 [Clostridia bacterium]|nr:hypothetical protein [Clostridia bacterium]
MTLTEKVSYLKGLMEGMSFDKTSNEGKVIAAMADILDDLAMTVSDLDDEVGTLNDYIEEIDEDLGAVEEEVFECCDDDCDCCDDDDCDCCDCDDDVIEVECPNCGETVFFDESIDPEHLVCPACNKEFSCICDCCDCDDDECDCGCCDEEK